MKRSIPVAICLIMLVGLAQPAVAQSAGSGKVFEPLQIGPDTSTYTIHAMLSPTAESACSSTLAELNGNYSSGGESPVMVNNPNDPCVTDEYPSSAGNYQKALSPGVPPQDRPEGFPERPSDLPSAVPFPNWPGQVSGTSFTIYSAMKVPAGTKFVEGETMGGELYMWVDSLQQTQGTAPSIGSLSPRVSLVLHNQTLATWSSGSDAITTLAPDTETGRRYIKFDVDWGAVPEEATYGGSLRVVVRLTAPLESTGLLFGISTVAEHRSTLRIPFETVALPDDGSDNETADNNTTEAPDVNNTTDTPDVNNTTVPDGNETADPGNNTTADVPEEKGFLPGFETIGVLVAGALAVARYDRQRRRPLGHVGS